MNKKEKAMFQQMQEAIVRLESNQNTENIIVRALNNNSSVSAQPTLPFNFTEKETISDDQKKKAAYALNLCTVSVSQIVDYNDIYVLEQEYEAILNNLNIEEMPKDNALLSILKQILDTVTFFRIQEGDKKFIELKYQQRVKEAIWSAVPNIGVLFASGNPITLAVSLATQIGMGYMNYRKEKAKINLDHEEEIWKLQRSAIEQFNGLRRELFDTAWRLAEKYDFPDNYRLTERQIRQYNSILMDSDNLRRFERLLSIKDNFQAYLPFWYYLGNAARLISLENGNNKNTSDKYISLAKEYYKKYLDSDESYSLLRENQTTCSCALEYIELPGIDDKEKIKYLNRAVEMSGNAPDVLQLCAVEYLSLGDRKTATSIFRQLINEGYNTIINSQILSIIYVADKSLGQDVEEAYYSLSHRVNNDYLALLPNNSENFNYDNYIEVQSKILRIKYILVVKQLYELFEEKYNNLIPRISNPSTYLENRSKREEYIEVLRKTDVSNAILILFNELIATVSALGISSEDACAKIANVLEQNKTVFLCYYNNDEYLKKLAYLSFDDFAEEYFKCVIHNTEKIEKIDNLQDITTSESDLKSFCNTHYGIRDPDYLYDHMDDRIPNLTDEGYFNANVFAENSALANTELYKKIKAIANDAKSLFLDTELQVLTSDDGFAFRSYFNENDKKKNGFELRAKAIFVIDDKSKRNHDIIVTDKEYIPVVRGRAKKAISYSKALDYCKSYNELEKKAKKVIDDIHKARKGLKETEKIDFITDSIDEIKFSIGRINHAKALYAYDEPNIDSVSDFFSIDNIYADWEYNAYDDFKYLDGEQ